MQLKNNDSSACLSCNSSTESSPTPGGSPSQSTTSSRRSSVMSKETPKMSTPLWIKLSAELLMAPKKKVNPQRRFSKTAPDYDSGSTMSSQADNSMMKTVGESRRSIRSRSRICRDLFGAKMAPIRG